MPTVGVARFNSFSPFLFVFQRYISIGVIVSDITIMSLSGIFVFTIHTKPQCVKKTCLLTKGHAPKLYLKGISQKPLKKKMI